MGEKQWTRGGPPRATQGRARGNVPGWLGDSRLRRPLKTLPSTPPWPASKPLDSSSNVRRREPPHMHAAMHARATWGEVPLRPQPPKGLTPGARLPHRHPCPPPRDPSVTDLPGTEGGLSVRAAEHRVWGGGVGRETAARRCHTEPPAPSVTRLVTGQPEAGSLLCPQSTHSVYG